jgi:hypothetical protein
MTRLPTIAALLLVPWISSAALGQSAERPADGASSSARALAKQVETLYRDGKRDEVDALARAHPGAIVAFDDASAKLEVAARYTEHAGGGDMELVVLRPAASVDRPLLVSFPPGSYGMAPDVQDLGFLRSPVVLLDAGQRGASVHVPVACASFFSMGPADGRAFTVGRFERGSEIDKLMCALCTGDAAPEAAAQLAIWIVRNGITRGDLEQEPGVVTFGHHVAIGLATGVEAGVLIRDAGLDPSVMAFFGESGDPSRPHLGHPHAAPRSDPRSPADPT